MPVSVSCPRGHSGARIVRAGTYGSDGHRRQLFRCAPATGPAHRFAERLPRQVLDEGTVCHECLNPLTAHEGQPYPRRYRFPARQIAAALASVAAGSSYREAGEAARVAAKRDPHRASAPGTAVPANLVGDWVEAFAEPLWQAHGHKVWPDVIVIDEMVINGLSRRQRKARSQPWPAPALTATGKKKGGVRLYSILVAEGYPNRHEHRLWSAWACPSGTEAEWAAFFRSLDGRPTAVVGDAAHAWQRAVAAVWPAPGTPAIVISEFHLGRIITGHLYRLRVPRDARVWRLCRRPFRSTRAWGRAVGALNRLARERHDEQLARFLAGRKAEVGRQIARRDGSDALRSTGSVENRIKTLGSRLDHRRSLYRNRERLNRLLWLYVLELAARTDRRPVEGRDWAATIRAWLDTRAGSPDPVRAIADHGASSLRYVPPPPGKGRKRQPGP